MPRLDRLPAWTMWAASVLAFVLLLATSPHTSCHARGSCGADVSIPLLIGLLVGAPLAGHLNRTVAAALAVLLAGYWSFGYVDAPTFGPAAYLTVLGYAGFGLLFRRERRGDARSLPDPEFHAAPPTPAELPYVGGRWWLAAGLSGLAGAGLAGWGQTLINEVDQLQDRSSVGLASTLMCGAAILGSVAVGAGFHVAARNRAIRRLFTNAQPVRSVRLVTDEGAQVSVLDLVDEVVIPVRPESDGRPATIGHGRLYGDPVVGGWFATVIDGRLRVPVGPARLLPLLRWMAASDLPPREPDLWEEDDEEGKDEPVPDRLLVGPDRSPIPGALRTQRVFIAGPWWPLAFVLFLPTQLLRPLRHFSSPVVVGVVAAAIAFVLEAVWRRGLVQARFDWNDGGIVAYAGGKPPVRLTWPDVSSIDRSGDEVTMSTHSGGYYTMSGRGARNRDELWAALTDTWRRARAAGISTVEPPQVTSHRRPLGLFALWVATTGLICGFAIWVYSLPT